MIVEGFLSGISETFVPLFRNDDAGFGVDGFFDEFASFGISIVVGVHAWAGAERVTSVHFFRSFACFLPHLDVCKLGSSFGFGGVFGVGFEFGFGGAIEAGFFFFGLPFVEDAFFLGAGRGAAFGGPVGVDGGLIHDSGGGAGSGSGGGLGWWRRGDGLGSACVLRGPEACVDFGGRLPAVAVVDHAWLASGRWWRSGWSGGLRR